jgi:hypothetical protein
LHLEDSLRQIARIIFCDVLFSTAGKIETQNPVFFHSQLNG